MTYLLRLYSSYMRVALLTMTAATCAFCAYAGFLSGSGVFYISFLTVLGVSLSALVLIKVNSRIPLSDHPVGLFIAILLPTLLIALLVSATAVLLIIIWHVLGAALGMVLYRSRSESYRSTYVKPSRPLDYHHTENYRARKSA